MKQLKDYLEKRDFGKTPEPAAKQKAPRKKKKLVFVIQRHNARRLHYDFRIEDGGVLKSFAVPNGIPIDASEKRLAVETEDHPLDYANFEGMIPKGSYGAGTVKIWDKGYFVNITIKQRKVMPLKKALKNGHFLIWIKGKKFEGGYAFTKTSGKEWMLVKMRDDTTERKYPKAIEIGKKTIYLTNPEKNLYGSLKKGDLFLYYKKVAAIMLPHIIGRPVSMYRFPDGVEEGFFQKNVPNYFPSWIDTAVISKVRYVVCNDEASILYLANQVLAFHVFTSKSDKPDFPDRIIFDLDPSKKDLELLKKTALSLKRFLEEIGFVPYIMATGGKGYHIVVPIVRDSTILEVRSFAQKIAEVFAKSNPGVLTTELRLEKRKDGIFIDVNRNSPKQTAIAPYSVRALPNLPIAKPFDWKELKTTDPDTYNILSNVSDDPWHDMQKHKVSLKKVISGLKKL